MGEVLILDRYASAHSLSLVPPLESLRSSHWKVYFPRLESAMIQAASDSSYAVNVFVFMELRRARGGRCRAEIAYLWGRNDLHILYDTYR